MEALAVVFQEPKRIAMERLTLTEPAVADAVVEVLWSSISTGTERLLWTGDMPAFPGMGYPLVPGYESVGRILKIGDDSHLRPGDLVFIPGANCFEGARGLFGGSASQLVVKADRLIPLADTAGPESVLLALAATAHHALAGGALPELIIGHGVLGRLMARLVLAMGGPRPTVWETNPRRCDGALDYGVLAPEADTRRDYGVIVDASGDHAILDTAIARLRHGGEVVLAGFYHERLAFTFPPAFMREARIRIAAEWRPDDMAAVTRLRSAGRLSLRGLITHELPAAQAETAYATAFGDVACLKMVLNWRGQA